MIARGGDNIRHSSFVAISYVSSSRAKLGIDDMFSKLQPSRLGSEDSCHKGSQDHSILHAREFTPSAEARQVQHPEFPTNLPARQTWQLRPCVATPSASGIALIPSFFQSPRQSKNRQFHRL